MNDVIYDEFKGTAYSEMMLDRKLQERRTSPTINVPASGTRPRGDAPRDRGRAADHAAAEDGSAGQIEATELLLKRHAKTKTNSEFLAIAKAWRRRRHRVPADRRTLRCWLRLIYALSPAA
jgi:transcription termination factor Rho